MLILGITEIEKESRVARFVQTVSNKGQMATLQRKIRREKERGS